MTKKINSILIANRGEIALRVIRACRELGIKSISIFSDEDVWSVHVKRADKAYHVGPASPAQSYL
ncbi:MAG: acetyl-CoA carboxylase biotin carboxylase subunit, partial [Thermoproteota archaeon]|nr:acetyl-CoA carboxylase biotin carboxylase subunit [Thermoproteota archaeon]